MTAIRYRNPLRPDEAGLMLICKQTPVQEARAYLERHGFVIVEDESAPARRMD